MGTKDKERLNENDLQRLEKTRKKDTEDASLSYRSDGVHQLNEAMNKDLATVSEWLKGNKLSLNVAKAKAMVISTKQKE